MKKTAMKVTRIPVEAYERAARVFRPKVLKELRKDKVTITLEAVKKTPEDSPVAFTKYGTYVKKKPFRNA